MKPLRRWGWLTRLRIGKGFKHRIGLAEGIGEEDKELIPGDSCLLGDLGYCCEDRRPRDVRLISLSDGLNDLDVDLDVEAGVKRG
jgi:hypothetical protein